MAAEELIIQEIKAYVGLGSNIEDREHHLNQAIALLDQHPNIEVTASSSIYETDPVGFLEQASFLNMVLLLTTTLPARELLYVILEVEQKLGRTRELRWGPRTIDLDLLLYGEQEISVPELIVPHPRMGERAFVMIPLLEVMAGYSSVFFESLSQQLEKLDGKEGVILWK